MPSQSPNVVLPGDEADIGRLALLVYSVVPYKENTTSLICSGLILIRGPFRADVNAPDLQLIEDTKSKLV